MRTREEQRTSAGLAVTAKSLHEHRNWLPIVDVLYAGAEDVAHGDRNRAGGGLQGLSGDGGEVEGRLRDLTREVA